MPVRKYLARDFEFAISEDNRATWTTISGIGSWSFTVDSNEEDTSTFDNGAWGSGIYTQRTGSLTLEGFYLVDGSNGTRDPGQLKAERAATLVGYDAYKDWRVKAISSSGVEIGNFVFTGQAALADMGGSTTDVMPWGIDLVFEGKPVGSGIFNIFN